jgi:transcriptional regulator with XRE-family HTH domain
MNFRALRRQSGLSQYRLAQQTGVQSTTISQLELGKVRNPTYATVAALANGLGTTPQVVAACIAETSPRRRRVA